MFEPVDIISPATHTTDQSQMQTSLQTVGIQDTSTRQPWLSCEPCRKRKVKCDKGDPCSVCVRLGTKCITDPRARLSRGRQGGRPKRYANLLDRIQDLEDLIRNTIKPEASVTTTAACSNNISSKVIQEVLLFERRRVTVLCSQ